MSNRRKLRGKFSKLSRARESRQRFLKATLGQGTQIDQYGLAQTVTAPSDEAEVIKEVPAVVTHPQTKEKVTVGTAFISDDRSVAIKFNDDAPQWAMDLIKATEQEVGYSLETGGPAGG